MERRRQLAVLLLGFIVAVGGAFAMMPYEDQPAIGDDPRTTSAPTTAAPTTAPTTAPPTTGTTDVTVTDDATPDFRVSAVEIPNEVDDGLMEVTVEVQNDGRDGTWTREVRTYRGGYPDLYDNRENPSMDVEHGGTAVGTVTFDLDATGEWPVLVAGERIGVVDVVGLSHEDSSADRSDDERNGPTVDVTVDVNGGAE